MAVAAVTPRPPPVTTTTSPSWTDSSRVSGRRGQVGEIQGGSSGRAQADLQRTSGEEFLGHGAGGGSWVGKLPQVDGLAGDLRPFTGRGFHQSGQTAGERVGQ